MSRQFDPFNIHPDLIIHEHIVRFIHAVDTKLNSKVESMDKYIRIPFSHAVYHKLFNNRSYLSRNHFKREYFTPGWDQSYSKHVGENQTIHSGSRVLFPIQVYLYVPRARKVHFCKHREQYNKKPIINVEMLRMFFNKEDCGD